MKLRSVKNYIEISDIRNDIGRYSAYEGELNKIIDTINGYVS